MGVARVQLMTRHDGTHAVRPHDSHIERLSCFPGSVFQRLAAVQGKTQQVVRQLERLSDEAGSGLRRRRQSAHQDHDSPHAVSAQFAHDRRDATWRRTHDGEVGRFVDGLDVGKTGCAEHRCAALRIHGKQLPLEFTGQQVLEDDAAKAVLPFGGADHGDRARLEETLHVSDGHALPSWSSQSGSVSGSGRSAIELRPRDVQS